MVIQEIIQRLMAQGSQNAIRIMRSGLEKKRGGNQLPHSTTSKTLNSIKSEVPKAFGRDLEWEFTANEAAIRLNTGGSVPMGTTPTDVPYGSFTSPGGESQYIKALITWCKRKYGLDDISAKKMAFAVAQSASNRGRTVKNPGWFDEVEQRVYKQIVSDIQAIMMTIINKNINEQLKGNV